MWEGPQALTAIKVSTEESYNTWEPVMASLLCQLWGNWEQWVDWLCSVPLPVSNGQEALF